MGKLTRRAIYLNIDQRELLTATLSIAIEEWADDKTNSRFDKLTNLALDTAIARAGEILEALET